jgi:hypothetical protein
MDLKLLLGTLTVDSGRKDSGLGIALANLLRRGHK